MGHKPRTRDELYEQARQYVAAARAYHTGLIAESHKHLHVLSALSRYVDVLRQDRRRVQEKLASVQACCRELARLRRMRQPWRDTYDDLRHSLIRARAVFQRLVKTSSRKRTRV
jgi:hypothetical protein